MRILRDCYKRLKSYRRMKEVVVIHSMGKVGSSSIQSTIKSFYSGKVFHTHFLNEERFHKHYDSLINKGLKVNGHIKQSEFLIKNWNKIEKFKIVCLIREPIGRNISAFFQNLDSVFMPDFMDKNKDSSSNIDDLINTFLTDYHMIYP